MQLALFHSLNFPTKSKASESDVGISCVVRQRMQCLLVIFRLMLPLSLHLPPQRLRIGVEENASSLQQALHVAYWPRTVTRSLPLQDPPRCYEGSLLGWYAARDFLMLLELVLFGTILFSTGILREGESRNKLAGMHQAE